MRTITDRLSRNLGSSLEIFEEPIASNKVFNGDEQPNLAELGEGEFILDNRKYRPLIKVNGELKQMKVDKNGFVFYDTPTDKLYRPTPSSLLDFLSPTNDSNKTFYLPIQFGLNDVANGSKSIGTVPKGYTIDGIDIYVQTAFVGITPITMEITEWQLDGMSLPGAVFNTDAVDLTTTGIKRLDWFRITSYDTVYGINFYGTPAVAPYRAYLRINYKGIVYL